MGSSNRPNTALRRVSLGLLAGACAVATVPSQAGAPEFVTSIRGWYTTIERPLAGREPGWPVTIVAIDRPATRIPYAAPPLTGERHHLEGIASFYWQDQLTANGERFEKSDFTAAHLTLPFGTRVQVTNAINGRTVVVRINDRGPYKPGRIIDLSEAAGHAIGMKDTGIVPVQIKVLN